MHKIDSDNGVVLFQKIKDYCVVRKSDLNDAFYLYHEDYVTWPYPNMTLVNNHLDLHNLYSTFDLVDSLGDHNLCVHEMSFRDDGELEMSVRSNVWLQSNLICNLNINGKYIITDTVGSFVDSIVVIPAGYNIDENTFYLPAAE